MAIKQKCLIHLYLHLIEHKFNYLYLNQSLQNEIFVFIFESGLYLNIFAILVKYFENFGMSSTNAIHIMTFPGTSKWLPSRLIPNSWVLLAPQVQFTEGVIKSNNDSPDGSTVFSGL